MNKGFFIFQWFFFIAIFTFRQLFYYVKIYKQLKIKGLESNKFFSGRRVFENYKIYKEKIDSKAFNAARIVQILDYLLFILGFFLLLKSFVFFIINS